MSSEISTILPSLPQLMAYGAISHVLTWSYAGYATGAWAALVRTGPQAACRASDRPERGGPPQAERP